MNEDLLSSLKRAVEASPDDTGLRLHVAGMLLDAGRYSEAIGEANTILRQDPTDPAALALLNRTVAAMTAVAGGPGQSPGEPVQPGAVESHDSNESGDPAAVQPGTEQPGEEAQPGSAAFDWTRAEREIGSDVPPPFVKEPQLTGEDGGGSAALEPEVSPITLKDVGGLEPVKKRLDESFLQPMKNAELAKAFGKSLRGGLLLYGPPGCGKTFLARAVAGELGAVFMSATMTDILDPYLGITERNLKAIFDSARAHSPTVLFLDEVDAIGMKRSSLGGRNAIIRQMVNQLLIEMDSMAGNNDGLYLLAATNHPWDLDEALMRPGRLDRTLLVTPPDFQARTTILEYHLRDRPLAGINLGQLATATEMFSGADLEHLCVTAAEKAMMESISANRICPITMEHMEKALGEIGPSVLPWLESSRNVVKFSNEHGRYNDLAEYLRSRNML